MKSRAFHPNFETDDELERLAALYMAHGAKRYPHLAAAFFCSPLSARTPDLNLTWHPVFRRRHLWRLWVSFSVSLLVALPKGFARMFLGSAPKGFCRYGAASSTLLVLTSSCGSESQNADFQTSYVSTKPDNALFVYGPLRGLGRKKHPFAAWSFSRKVTTTVDLVRAGVSGCLAVGGTALERCILFFIWMNWTVSLAWYELIQLEETLERIIRSEKIGKVGCVHEMHYYTRAVWRAASLAGARTHTVQHACVAAGKTWYRTYPEERAAGLALPQVFFVFDQRSAAVLQPWFPGTQIRFGCSQRYAHWIDREPEASVDDSGSYLFVAGLANFDNEVVLNALRVLLRSPHDGQEVRLRLHPHAQLNFGQRRWLARLQARGMIELSTRELQDDIREARVVVGMSTSVLEEALLMEKPVVQLRDSRYRVFLDLADVPGLSTLAWRDLSWDRLRSTTAGTTHQLFRSRLGLDKPIVTYGILFSNT